jgi:hypothetical protein
MSEKFHSTRLIVGTTLWVIVLRKYLSGENFFFGSFYRYSEHQKSGLINKGFLFAQAAA